MAPIPTAISSRALNSLNRPIRNRTNEKGSFDDCFFDALRGAVARATIPWYLTADAVDRSGFLRVSCRSSRSSPSVASTPPAARRPANLRWPAPAECAWTPFLPQPPGIGRNTSGCSRDEIGLQFRREHQVAVALAFAKRAWRIFFHRLGSRPSPCANLPPHRAGSAPAVESLLQSLQRVSHMSGEPVRFDVLQHAPSPAHFGAVDPARLGRAVRSSRS